MKRKFGLPNIITHLHREPGIDFATDPELFEAAYDARDALKSHFALEGLELLIDPQLQVMSLVLMDIDKLNRSAEQSGYEPFRPIYASRAEDYWSSVLLIILRLRYESAIANPEAAWISEDDLYAQYLDYQDAEHRDNSHKVLDQMRRKLKDLEGRRFVQSASPRGQMRHYSATKWLVVRLTDDILEERIQEMALFQQGSDRLAAAKEKQAEEIDLFDDLVSEAKANGSDTPDLGGDLVAALTAN